MKFSVFTRAALILGYCLSTSGCAYLTVEREGGLFPSTSDIWDTRQKYLLPPTVGGWSFLILHQIPYVGPFISYPVSYTVHYTEGCVIAPLYDMLCMPYDLCKRPEYLEKRRLREEAWRASKLVREDFTKALDDGRYFSSSNIVYYKAMSDRLEKLTHDSLTTDQVVRVVSAIRHDESILLDMCGVAGQIAMGNEEREWFIRKAIEFKNSGRGKDSDILVAAICRSRGLSDDQYKMLVDAGFPNGIIDLSRRNRDDYSKRLAEEAAKKEARRKAAEARQAQIRAIEERAIRKEAERQRRDEAARMRIEALTPFVEALFSDDVNVFHSALQHVDDDPWLRTMWSDAISHDMHCRKVRHDYLVALLEIAEKEPEKGKWLKKAILEQKEIGEELSLKYYQSAVSGRDMETVRILLQNEALPDHILRLAYTNPDLASIRYAAATSKKFPWPIDGEDRKEFIAKAQELFLARRRGEIDETSLNAALDSLMKKMLPVEMPTNWRRCIPRRL